jgi:6-phosphogluconolactonase
MPMKVIVRPDAAAAAAEAARLMADQIAAAIRSRGSCCIALSGGRTPWQMLETLLGLPVDWQAVHVFQVDERAVPGDDERRNARRIRELLVREGALPAARFHAMPVEAAELSGAAADYGRTLARYAGQPPVLDVVQLGLGDDGHTASLVPGDPLLGQAGSEVGVSGVYQGTRRMTLTFAPLDRARCVLWLVTGAAKAPALCRLVAGDDGIPASRVARGRATVVADAAAASTLTGDAGRPD